MPVTPHIKVNSVKHNFAKTSLVTEKGGFDYYTCEDCGLKGKRFGFSDWLNFPKNVDKNKLNNCTGGKVLQDDFVGKYATISRCTAVGDQFKNLTPGSRHKIVTPPQGYFNGDEGVWVMGVGEPVKVLDREISHISEPTMRRTR